MNRAFGTGWFIDLVWALINTLHRIIKQLLTFSTQVILRTMMFPAINLNHYLKSMPFPIQAILINFHM
jgi:hypothetical protein